MSVGNGGQPVLMKIFGGVWILKTGASPYGSVCFYFFFFFNILWSMDPNWRVLFNHLNAKKKETSTITARN